VRLVEEHIDPSPEAIMRGHSWRLTVDVIVFVVGSVLQSSPHLQRSHWRSEVRAQLEMSEWICSTRRRSQKQLTCGYSHRFTINSRSHSRYSGWFTVVYPLSDTILGFVGIARHWVRDLPQKPPQAE